jgi:hypothetical protein
MSGGGINLRLLAEGGRASSFDVVARVEAVGAGSAPTREPIDIIVPSSSENGHDVPLEAGLYNIQLFLPNGRVLQKACEVEIGAAVALTFQEPPSGAAGFSLQEAAGNQTLEQMLGSALGSRTAATRDAADAMSMPIVEEVLKVGKRSLPRGRPASGGAYGAGSLKRGRSTQAAAEDGRVMSVRKGAADRQPARRATPRGNTKAASQGTDAVPGRGPSPAPRAIARLRLMPPGAFAGSDGWRALAKEPTSWAGTGRPVEAKPDVAKDAAAIWRLAADVAGHAAAPHDRIWGLVRAAKGLEMVSVPAPWRCSGSGRLSPVDILVDGAVGGRAGTTVAIHDAALDGLLSYLDRGQLGALRPMLSELEGSGLIERTIGDKFSNPLAACAAAYVGLALHEPSAAHRWDAWLPNVVRSFPWIPDGAVAEARRTMLRARGPDAGAEATRLLKRALDAGVPYYSVGLLLMREMLEMLEPEHELAGELLALVEPVVARCDPRQMFTVLRYPEARP